MWRPRGLSCRARGAGGRWGWRPLGWGRARAALTGGGRGGPWEAPGGTAAAPRAGKNTSVSGTAGAPSRVIRCYRSCFLPLLLPLLNSLSRCGSAGSPQFLCPFRCPGALGVGVQRSCKSSNSSKSPAVKLNAFGFVSRPRRTPSPQPQLTIGVLDHLLMVSN